MHPVPSFSLEVAEGLFFWSNVSYVVGALLTLASAGLILYTKRSKTLTIPVPSFVLTDAAVFLPACISLLGTVGAIYFSGVVLNLERASLQHGRVRPAVLLSRAEPPALLASRDAEPDTVRTTASDRPLLLRDSEPFARPDSLPDTPAEPAPLVAPAATRRGGSPAATGTKPPDTFDVSPAEAPRTLDTGAASATALQSYQGMKATVETTGSDPEASALADHVLVVLLANGLDARDGTSTSVLHQMSGRPGIHIRYLDPNRGHDLAAALATLLRRNALAVDVAPAWDLAAGTPRSHISSIPPEQILISVGPKR